MGGVAKEEGKIEGLRDGKGGRRVWKKKKEGTSNKDLLLGKGVGLRDLGKKRRITSGAVNVPERRKLA